MGIGSLASGFSSYHLSRKHMENFRSCLTVTYQQKDLEDETEKEFKTMPTYLRVIG